MLFEVQKTFMYNWIDFSKFDFWFSFRLDNCKLWNNSEENIMTMDIVLEYIFFLCYCMKNTYTPAGVSIKDVIQDGKNKTSDF